MNKFSLMALVLLTGCANLEKHDEQWAAVEKLRTCVSQTELKNAEEVCNAYFPLGESEYKALSICLIKKNIIRNIALKETSISSLEFKCRNWVASVSYVHGASPPKIEGVYEVLP